MKKLLSLLLCLTLSLPCMAQQTRHVDQIHLNNGKKYKGVILPSEMQGKVLLKTDNGETLLFDRTEISVITKKEYSSNGELRRDEKDIVMNANGGMFRGYKAFLNFGYSVGIGSQAEDAGNVFLSTTHGYQFCPNFYLGAGTGLHYYTSIDHFEIPIFVDARVDFRDEFSMMRKFTPFLDFKVGYAVFDKRGLYLCPMVGARMQMGRNGLNFGLGYTSQSLYSENHGGITIQVGIDF